MSLIPRRRSNALFTLLLGPIALGVGCSDDRAASGGTGARGGVAGSTAGTGGVAGTAGNASGGMAGTAGTGGVAGSAGSGAAGSAGSGGQGGSGGSTPCDAPGTVFAYSCSNLNCHSTYVQAASLDLQSMGVAMRVRDVDASLNDDCAGHGKLVNVANPDASLMLTKLEDAPPCGNRMPDHLSAPLSAEQKQCVRDWVLWVVLNP